MVEIIGVIAIDMDGTIAEYGEWKGWRHIGKPIVDKNGISAKDFLTALKDNGWIIVIHSTRGSEQLADYMAENGLPYDYINVNPEVLANNMGKPLANIYLDDRGITFVGDYAVALEMIMKFKPWCGKGESLIDENLHKEEEEVVDEKAKEEIDKMLEEDGEEGPESDEGKKEDASNIGVPPSCSNGNDAP